MTYRPVTRAVPSGDEARGAPGPATPSAWAPTSASRTRVVLVRHGVTEYSLAHRFAGRSDLELTPLGHEQAARAAARVADLGPVHAVLTSPLRRTRHTAAAIAERLGLPVAVDDDLVETDFGDWDGYTMAEIGARWPVESARWLADPAVAPPAGESFDDVAVRVDRARARIVAAHTGGTVVVVSHVTPIKQWVRRTLDAPASALHRMYLAPAAICVIDHLDGGGVSLRSYNDTSHLP